MDDERRRSVERPQPQGAERRGREPVEDQRRADGEGETPQPAHELIAGLL
jgi:hypothetical protein